MHDKRIWEWSLARFIGDEKATSIVGDLEEGQSKKGQALRLRSLLSVLFALAGRTMCSIVLASIGAGYMLYSVSVAFSASTQFHDPGAIDRAWASSLAVVVGLLCFVGILFLVRYGIRNVVGLLATAYAVLGCLAVSFWWFKPLVLTVAAISCLLLVATVFFRVGRRAMLVIAVSVVMQAVAWLSGLTALCALGKYFVRSIGLAEVCLAAEYILISTLLCIACGWLNKKIVTAA